ncbi:RNA polymerase sigma factor [Nocardioides flavus (ex Wang et al. 2016)]|uniref:RNA polymerase sigma factor n=1 Tax=Nocardioides flavus (ex Wang et al. 2016) TaxID=2058780 RepID=A0ABQ3HPA2_9ACTN|nr:sigma-70 family RNA polymerase sigma factor [Nocardioides flavus (ex Wang et al. 2016)]GHE18487.1 RNA polymerase sigma factor [Nocardioides flavus (ex Wang et al. 2016)]
MPADPTDDTSAAVTAAWRAESARLVGALVRMTRDVDLAEDLAQDALVAALEQWPATGVPDNPSAWLMTTAKRRGVDHYRRADALRRKVAELEHGRARGGGEEAQVPDLVDQVDHIEDDVLRLVFLTCHPVLTPESRAALTLRLVGGLTTAEVARGFLTTETTMGQRISRAKKTLASARAELELPTGEERTARLDDVMAVIYLIFNEGYTATAGADWMRPDLAAEATRLARMLTDLVPCEPEVLGLQALLELQGSRTAARLSPDGTPVLLEAQDRTQWDPLMVRRGLTALRAASRLAATGTPVGKYFLQASIAAEHARAARAEDTDWARIAALYDVLARAAPGPVVEVNRAVAHGRAHGADAGLAVLDAVDPSALAGSPLLPSVRGDLLERSGRRAEASAAFAEAARRTRNEGERTVLLRRAAQSGPPPLPAAEPGDDRGTDSDEG